MEENEAVLKYAHQPIYSAILWILREGRAYTLIEISNCIKVSREETKNALNKIKNEGFISTVERRTRTYYKLTSKEIIQEVILHNSDFKIKKSIPLKNNTGIKYCRTCYDHLAGKIGVKITEKLFEKGLIQRKGRKISLSDKGEIFFNELGINIEPLKSKGVIDGGNCLDFSERKYHLGGDLGKVLFQQFIKLNWVEKTPGSRVIKITTKGKKMLSKR